MPTAACKNIHQCLSRREVVMRCDAIWVRDHECMGCSVGTARRMTTWKPEEEINPLDNKSPAAVARRLKKPPTLCSACGVTIQQGSKLCKKCWGLSRRVNHAKCSKAGCRWLARRGGFCASHYYAEKNKKRRRGA